MPVYQMRKYRECFPTSLGEEPDQNSGSRERNLRMTGGASFQCGFTMCQGLGKALCTCHLISYLKQNHEQGIIISPIKQVRNLRSRGG